MIDRLNAALEGRYRIERELGEGGMATVYLADDLKHNRKVALKVLKPDLAQMLGKDRFFAEIETTAQLQHPNILPLFDSGEADGFLFYAMPYVEGETLAEKLRREVQLPIDQSLDLIRKVAAALDYAHQRGIVHRDIKPANILLSSGEPLVADFGIALAVQQAGEGRMTQTGLSMGTPQYMSPEQASGDRSLDPRSDVYALGAVLYEMLAGDPPFSGSSAQSILARILTTLPQRVTVQRPTVPPHVDATISKALEKIPADRFSTAGDFRKALDDPGFRHTTVTHIESMQGPPVVVRTRQGPLAGILAGVLVVTLAVLGWVVTRPEPPRTSQKYRIELDFTAASGSSTIALAADGRRMVYLNGQTVSIRATSDLGVRTVETGDVARGVFMSPDGQSVGYITGNGTTDGVAVVRVEGGTPVRVASPPGGVQPSATWSEDGYIYVVGETVEHPLWRVAEGGGPAEEVMPSLAADREGLFFLSAIPGHPGRLLAFRTATSEVVVLDVEADELIPVPDNTSGFAPRFARGHLFWIAENGDLLARPFDPVRVSFSGPPLTLAQNVLSGNFDVSESGLLIYRTTSYEDGGATSGETLGWIDRTGAVTILDDRLSEVVYDFDDVRLSPDGAFLAASAQIGADGAPDRADRILVYELGANSWFYLTLPGERNELPRWLDDGRVVYRTRTESGFAIRTQPFDRTGVEEVLFETEAVLNDYAITGDGEYLLVTLFPSESTPDLEQGVYAVDIGTNRMTPFLVAPYVQGAPQISPDGRWVAYESLESGVGEVYVQAFPGRSRPYPISSGRGEGSAWSPDGSELIYGDGAGTVTVAKLSTTDGVRVTERLQLFLERPRFELFGGSGATYDIAPDGRLLAAIEEIGYQESNLLAVVITDVFAEIEAQGGGGR